MKSKTKQVKYWETKDGTEIAYKDLGDTHLLNILKWVKRLADNGMIVEDGGGGWDIEDCWYEVYEIKGKEVYKKYDYDGLKKEAIRRKLIRLN